MKIKLNESQMKFLDKKFGFKEDDIEKMDLEEWNKIREVCFEIETDELLDFEKTGKDCDNCDTEDYLMASSIIDLPCENR